jgi:pilus assembly protein CpaF
MSVADTVHASLLADPTGPAPGPEVIGALVRRTDPLLTAAAVARAVAAVQSRLAGLGPIDPFLADPLVTDVLVNGPGPVWIERDGRLLRSEVVLDRAQIDLLVERVVAPLGRRADPGSPVVDARLPDGSRVHVVVPPLAVDGPCVTIRRFSTRPIELHQVAGPHVVDLLRWAVRARSNVVVSGGTGSGKTTLLNALGREIPGGERIVTVEDAAELRFPSDHVVRLEARTASAEGTGEVTCRELLRSALRMRPDRIVVGEVRDATALDMVQAMNTGHDGSLSTVHANSCDDAVRRLEALVLLAGIGLSLDAVRDHLAAAVDLIVHLERGADGCRRVVEVAEVVAPGSPVPVGRRSTVIIAAGDRLVGAPVRSGRAQGAGPAPEVGS